jgi:hypothetical protein
VFTRALHLSQSEVRRFQSIPPRSTSLKSVLILSSHLRLVLPSGLFPSSFPNKILYVFFFYLMPATCPEDMVVLLIITYLRNLFSFLIRISGGGGGGVQPGPFGTSATNSPIVLAPGDYDDGEFGGMMICRGNRSTRRKPAPVPLCPAQTPHAARRGGKPATNRLSYGTADIVFNKRQEIIFYTFIQ